jgi:hypothetical protein
MAGSYQRSQDSFEMVWEQVLSRAKKSLKAAVKVVGKDVAEQVVGVNKQEKELAQRQLQQTQDKVGGEDKQKLNAIRQNLAKIDQEIKQVRDVNAKKQQERLQVDRQEKQKKQERVVEEKKKDNAIQAQIKSRKGTKEAMMKVSG